MFGSCQRPMNGSGPLAGMLQSIFGPGTFLKQPARLECPRRALAVAAGNSLGRERLPRPVAGKSFIVCAVTVKCNNRLGVWHSLCGQTFDVPSEGYLAVAR
jgi:hypothetical protein